MDIGSGLASLGGDIADAMGQYHKEHEAYDQVAGIAQALSKIGVNEQGVPVPIVDADGKPRKDVTQVIDPKALELVMSNLNTSRAVKKGQLDVLARLGLGMAQKVISSRIEDASLSGQRTRQVMSQDEQSFPTELEAKKTALDRAHQVIKQDEVMNPLDVEAKKATTAHIKKLTDEEGKINVPGFGLMTPPQFSAHTARMLRLDELKKKTEPILTFENQLQTAYGAGIQDIVDAAKPQKFAGGKGNKEEFTGTPFYNTTGDRISKEDANKDPESAFVLVGPNRVPIPLLDKKTGLGWQQITGKAANFSTRLKSLQDDQGKIQKTNDTIQAQQTMAYFQKIGKDPSQYTPEEQAAYVKAKALLGQ